MYKRDVNITDLMTNPITTATGLTSPEDAYTTPWSQRMNCKAKEIHRTPNTTFVMTVMGNNRHNHHSIKPTAWTKDMVWLNGGTWMIPGPHPNAEFAARTSR